MERFEKLMAAARAALAEAPEAEQALAVETASGKRAVFAGAVPAGEELISGGLTEPLAAMVCLWKNGQLDLPAFRVRKALLAAAPENASAAVYLQGAEGIGSRPLDRTF